MAEQQYEALVVLRGTLSEQEAGPAMDVVRLVIEKNGGTDISCHDIGKNRLAYPIEHIRYGYMRTCYFTAAAASVRAIQQKLLLADHVLRAAVCRFNHTKQTKRITPIAEGVIRRELREAAVEAAGGQYRSTAEVLHTASVVAEPARAPETVTEPRTTEAVEIQDIEKKLDEILESDLTKV